MLNDISSLQGKKVALTGSTGGLGKELCRFLCKAGTELIMVDRNTEKAYSLETELKAEFKDVKITRITADLEDISTVKTVAEEIVKLNPDFFLHNAGAYSIPRHITDLGYDNIFQINFVSPYYITKKLLQYNPEIKIVAVGSIAHNYSKINTDNIDFKNVKSNALTYGNSKRFLMYSLYNICENNLAIVHPGITFTGITNHYPKLIFAIIKNPMKIIFMKPKKAALSIIEGFYRNTPKYYWIGPSVFNIWGKPKCKKLKTSAKGEVDKISEIAEEIYASICG